MSRLRKYAGVAALVAIVAALAISSAASAQEARSATTASSLAHGGRGLCGEAGLEAAAEALGMTADELSTQLWGGETLSSLAEEAGVELQAVRDAVTAACEQAVRDAIEQAVEDGSLTREHADWLLEGLDNGYWGSGSGFGHGFGFGGRGFGRGGFHSFGGDSHGDAGFRGIPSRDRMAPDSSDA